MLQKLGRPNDKYPFPSSFVTYCGSLFMVDKASVLNRNNELELFLGIALIGLAIIQSNALLSYGGWAYFGNIPVFLFQTLLIAILYLNRRYLCPEFKTNTYRFIYYYLIWTTILIFAGFFVADCYVEYRQLLVGSISLQVPIFVWIFTRPEVANRVLSIYFKYAWLPFVIFFLPFLGFTQMYIQPILLLLCLAPLFRRKTALLIIVIGLLYTTNNIFEDRGQFIKGCVAMVASLGILFRGRISSKMVKTAHVLAYISSIFLLVFIFSDLFSVLVGSSSSSDIFYNNVDRDRRYQDTRSLLYVDVINSSIDHGYYLIGHTPARGFEVTYSPELFMDEDTVLDKGERHKNEMVLSNIFTWEGLIGLFLYSLIYMRGSYLAVYKSRNKIIPFLGCFVAWRWSWGWVEDVNNFMITDIDLWAMIAICYSSSFRNMRDEDFIRWSRSLLSKKKRC